MSKGDFYGLIEMTLVLVLVLGFGGYELISLRRSHRRDAEADARKAQSIEPRPDGELRKP